MATKDVEAKETGLSNRDKIINAIHTYIDVTNPTLCRKLNNRHDEADALAEAFVADADDYYDDDDWPNDTGEDAY